MQSQVKADTEAKDKKLKAKSKREAKYVLIHSNNHMQCMHRVWLGKLIITTGIRYECYRDWRSSI